MCFVIIILGRFSYKSRSVQPEFCRFFLICQIEYLMRFVGQSASQAVQEGLKYEHDR